MKEYLFSSVILARGYNYYISGHVLEIEENSEGYTATVEGAETYTVTLNINAGELIDADCSCPYSADGNYGSLQNCVGFIPVRTPERSKHNLQEEVFSIPVAIGFSPYCLDHIVDSLNPSG